MYKKSLIEKDRDKGADRHHDEHIAQITRIRQIPTPAYYRHIETGEEFYSISGALAWPAADSAGFAVIVGVKIGDDPPEPAFEALAEVESPSVEGLLKACCEIRGKWGGCRSARCLAGRIVISSFFLGFKKTSFME